MTDHVRATLDAAIALANIFGASQQHGRAQPYLDASAKREAVTGALRLATRQPPPIGRALAYLETGGMEMYVVLSHVVDGRFDRAVAATNALLGKTQAAPRLVRHEDAPWHLHFFATSDARGWLADLATAVAMLLGSADTDRLRRCEAAGCDIVFLDRTRNRRQRFCSLSCQNRTKVASFRARSQ